MKKHRRVALFALAALNFKAINEPVISTLSAKYMYMMIIATKASGRGIACCVMAASMAS